MLKQLIEHETRLRVQRDKKLPSVANNRDP
jgi:hypothetical protein